MIRHYGVFQFLPEITPEEIDECFTLMATMVGRIDGLLDFEHGPYMSDEGLNDGYTHGFIMTFDTAESRDAYLPHPIHEEVRAVVAPRLERLVVFDFAASAPSS